MPTLLGSLLGRGVRAVACGAAHSLAVTATGEVLTWGHATFGKLGFEATQPVHRPTPVPLMQGKRFVEVRAAHTRRAHAPSLHTRPACTNSVFASAVPASPRWVRAHVGRGLCARRSRAARTQRSR